MSWIVSKDRAAVFLSYIEGEASVKSDIQRFYEHLVSPNPLSKLKNREIFEIRGTNFLDL